MATEFYMLHLEVSSRIFNHLITLKLLRYQIAIMNIVQEEKYLRKLPLRITIQGSTFFCEENRLKTELCGKGNLNECTETSIATF